LSRADAQSTARRRRSGRLARDLRPGVERRRPDDRAGEDRKSVVSAVTSIVVAKATTLQGVRDRDLYSQIPVCETN